MVRAAMQASGTHRTLVFDRQFPSEIEILEGTTSLRTLVPKVEFKTACIHPDGTLVLVGAKNVVAFDVATGKKTKVAFKGHRACPNALLVDGNRLYSAAGSFIYTDDRFVRAFNLSNGEAVWKVGGKKAGFTLLAAAEGLLLAAAENAHVYAIRDGEFTGEAVVGGGGQPRADSPSIWLGPEVTALSASQVEWSEGEGAKATTWSAPLAVDAKRGTVTVGMPVRR
jgi:outer membrane protein assembly factor BamB